MRVTKSSLVVLMVTLLMVEFNALSQDSISQRSIPKRRFYKELIAPVALIGAGLSIKSTNHGLNTTIRGRRNESLPNFHTHLDDYLQYVPIATVYALNAAGIKGKNNFGNSMAMLIKSELVMTAITQPLKRFTHEVRPDDTADNSFPSGHTAQVFVAATFMHKEFGKKSIWYSIGAYTCATVVGTMRVLNNRHWASDVLVGAGIGILSTNLVYHTHRYKWGKNSRRTVVMPTYGKVPGLYVSYNFK